jgi:hypothetical protein
LNTVLFTLAGVIIGVSFGEDMRHFHHLGLSDVGYLVLLYFGMLAIRGVMVMLFYPCLCRMGYSIDLRDAFMLTWGGLRGALGLALALDVALKFRVLGEEDSIMGTRMLFHVGGFAMLTLLINGTTSAFFLRILGMTGTDIYTKKLTHQLEQRIQKECEKAFDEQASDILRNYSTGEAAAKAEVDRFREMVAGRVHAKIHKGMAHLKEMSEASKLFDVQVPDGQLFAVRAMFLTMLRGRYMELIEQGILKDQAQVSVILMGSVDEALNYVNDPLCDYEAVHRACDTQGCSKAVVDCADSLPACFLLREILENNGVAIRQHTVCYVLLCFVHAHYKNQEGMKELIAEAAPDMKADLEKVLEESQNAVKKACAVIDAIEDKSLVEEVKKDAIASTVLDSEYRFVMDLVEKGALQEKQAHHLLEGITAELVKNRKHMVEHHKRSALYSGRPEQELARPDVSS